MSSLGITPTSMEVRPITGQPSALLRTVVRVAPASGAGGTARSLGRRRHGDALRFEVALQPGRIRLPVVEAGFEGVAPVLALLELLLDLGRLLLGGQCAGVGPVGPVGERLGPLA